jgi:hypothetical protein
MRLPVELVIGSIKDSLEAHLITLLTVRNLTTNKARVKVMSR